MTWTDIILAATPIVVSLVLTYVFQPLVAAHVKDKNLQQWLNGGALAAGRVLNAIVAARAANPTAALEPIIAAAIKAEAENFFKNYQAVAERLGATPDEAQTMIAGKVGQLLAQTTPSPVIAPDPKISATNIVPLKS